MSTHNLCFEKKYEKYLKFLSKHFSCLVVKFSIYLNRRVSVMYYALCSFGASVLWNLKYSEHSSQRFIYSQRCCHYNEFAIVKNKGSIFLKVRHLIIQERFNKLIYGINTIIKCGT